MSALIGRLIINVKHVEDNKMTLAACLPLPDCPFEGQEGENHQLYKKQCIVTADTGGHHHHS
jgi:hypothetical protein